MPGIESFAGDLSIAAAAQGLLRRFPLVDILVNDLGIFEPKAFGDITDEEWRRFFELNVLSGVRLSRAYLPGMKERNWGRIRGRVLQDRPSSLLKRFATTEEVASLVTYVCSPLSSATNGAALRVDGGVVQACF